MTIDGLIKHSHERAVVNGWWKPDASGNQRTFGDLIALCHSELSEALEAFRGSGNCDPWIGEYGKPEGVPSELADVMIRIADMCGYYRIDLASAIELKLAYNATRGHRHGGKHL